MGFYFYFFLINNCVHTHTVNTHTRPIKSFCCIASMHLSKICHLFPFTFWICIQCLNVPFLTEKVTTPSLWLCQFLYITIGLSICSTKVFYLVYFWRAKTHWKSETYSIHDKSLWTKKKKSLVWNILFTLPKKPLFAPFLQYYVKILITFRFTLNVWFYH